MHPEIGGRASPRCSTTPDFRQPLPHPTTPAQQTCRSIASTAGRARKGQAGPCSTTPKIRMDPPRRPICVARPPFFGSPAASGNPSASHGTRAAPSRAAASAAARSSPPKYAPLPWDKWPVRLAPLYSNAQAAKGPAARFFMAAGQTLIQAVCCFAFASGAPSSKKRPAGQKSLLGAGCAGYRMQRGGFRPAGSRSTAGRPWHRPRPEP